MNPHQRRLWNSAVARVAADLPIPTDLTAALIEQGFDPSAITADTPKE